MRAHTGTRTLNTRIRNPLLCPIELYGRKTRGPWKGSNLQWRTACPWALPFCQQRLTAPCGSRTRIGVRMNPLLVRGGPHTPGLMMDPRGLRGPPSWRVEDSNLCRKNQVGYGHPQLTTLPTRHSALSGIRTHNQPIQGRRLCNLSHEGMNRILGGFKPPVDDLHVHVLHINERGGSRTRSPYAKGHRLSPAEPAVSLGSHTYSQDHGSSTLRIP